MAQVKTKTKEDFSQPLSSNPPNEPNIKEKISINHLPSSPSMKSKSTVYSLRLQTYGPDLKDFTSSPCRKPCISGRKIFQDWGLNLTYLFGRSMSLLLNVRPDVSRGMRSNAASAGDPKRVHRLVSPLSFLRQMVAAARSGTIPSPPLTVCSCMQI